MQAATIRKNNHQKKRMSGFRNTKSLPDNFNKTVKTDLNCLDKAPDKQLTTFCMNPVLFLLLNEFFEKHCGS